MKLPFGLEINRRLGDITDKTSTVIVASQPSPEMQPIQVQSNKTIQKSIVPIQLQRIRQDVLSWRGAIAEAELAYFPFRYKMQRLFVDTVLNGHVEACIERRKDLTILRKWNFINDAGTVDEATQMLFCDKVDKNYVTKQWFLNFISHAIDTLFYGYTLISMGDVIDNAYPNISVIQRWNISPDRLNVQSFPYMPNGYQFMNPEYKDWYIWLDTPNEIGASNCGYGLLYKIGIYEIMLRNILGFNGDYVESYAMPYRVGKTTKTDDTERDEFEAAVRAMGSSQYAIIDPIDEIAFIEYSQAGTGWKGYENLEMRCEKKISKVLLGHADALDSVPGKLGNSGEKSPAELALNDKQTKDGDWIISIVNGILIPAMRNVGFTIPETTKATLRNDGEVMETATSYADLATKIKTGGLQMSAEYFTEQTGVEVTLPEIPIPGAGGPMPPKPGDKPKPAADKPASKDLAKTVKNKLDEIYK